MRGGLLNKKEILKIRHRQFLARNFFIFGRIEPTFFSLKSTFQNEYNGTRHVFLAKLEVG